MTYQSGVSQQQVEMLYRMTGELKSLLGLKALVLRLENQQENTLIGVDLSANPYPFLSLEEGIFPASQLTQTQSVADIWADSHCPHLIWFVESGLRGVVVAPLVYLGKVMGMLEGYTAEPHNFTRDEISLASSFASMLSLAIRQGQELDEIRVLNQELAAADDIEQAYNIVLDKLQAFLHVDGAILYPYSSLEQGFEMEKQVTIGLGEDINFYHEPGQMVSYVFQQILAQDVFSVVDITDPIYRLSALTVTRMLEAGIHAFVGKVVRANSDLVGILFLNYSQPHVLKNSEWPGQ